MSDKLKMQFQNKCVGLTDDHRDYIYGTDWKGYAKALEKQVKELNKINEDPIDWKGLLVDHCTQCGYPRSNREYQTLEAKFKALEKHNKESGKENKTIRDAFVGQINFLLKLDRPNIIDTSMSIYKLIKK